MKPPVEPRQEDCCNSGCSPCIFEVYEKQLKLYTRFLETGKSERGKENGISDMEYTDFVLVSKVAVCNDHAILAFKRFQSEVKVWWSPGAHLLFKYNHNEKVCTRAYTPLKVNDVVDTDYDFMVMLKKYETGLVSNYLYQLNIGELTVWRGPYSIYEVAPNKYARIVMVAQGTGIAPFFSIISSILDDENDMTKIILFFSCHSQSSILFRNELYSFKSFWNFNYKVFVIDTEVRTPWKYQEPIFNHRLTYEDFEYLKPFTPNNQFLLCGSVQFMKQFKEFLLNNCVKPENVILF